MWMKDYLAIECGVTIHYGPFRTKIGDELFYIAHGEGLGSRNIGGKLLFACFRSKTGRMILFSHPSPLGYGLRTFMVKEQPAGQTCVASLHG